MYIKDTSTKIPDSPQVFFVSANNTNSDQKPDQIFYTVSIPNEDKIKQEVTSKILQNTEQTPMYNINLNQLNLSQSTKNSKSESLSNIMVNSNGEVINIVATPEIEAFLGSNAVQKLKQVNQQNKQVKNNFYMFFYFYFHCGYFRMEIRNRKQKNLKILWMQGSFS